MAKLTKKLKKLLRSAVLSVGDLIDNDPDAVHIRADYCEDDYEYTYIEEI